MHNYLKYTHNFSCHTFPYARALEHGTASTENSNKTMFIHFAFQTNLNCVRGVRLKRLRRALHRTDEIKQVGGGGHGGVGGAHLFGVICRTISGWWSGARALQMITTITWKRNK